MASDAQIIEKKLTKLYNSCKEKGLSDEDIFKASAPLREFIQTSKQKQVVNKFLRFVLFTAVLICIIAVVFKYDPTYRMLCIVGRLVSITTLRFYDWTGIYFIDCALYNPYYFEEGLTEEDCETCQDIEFIEAFENLDSKNMTEFLFDNIPIIVTDAIHDWGAMKEFDTTFIKKLYKEDEILATSKVCSLVSDVDVDFSELLENVGNKFATWNIRWSNCEIAANKILRRYFNRPYFLPDMVEVLGSWVFMASGTKRDPERAKLEKETQQDDEYFSAEGWKEFSKDDKMQWMAQIKGQYAITLTPNEICNEKCQDFSFELNPGEILIFTPKMWKFEYQPYGEEDSIALASMGDWE